MERSSRQTTRPSCSLGGVEINFPSEVAKHLSDPCEQLFALLFLLKLKNQKEQFIPKHLFARLQSINVSGYEYPPDFCIVKKFTPQSQREIFVEVSITHIFFPHMHHVLSRTQLMALLRQIQLTSNREEFHQKILRFAHFAHFYPSKVRQAVVAAHAPEKQLRLIGRVEMHRSYLSHRQQLYDFLFLYDLEKLIDQFDALFTSRNLSMLNRSQK